MSSLLSNPRAEAVLDRLREQDERQSSSMKEHVGSRIRAHRSADSRYMDVDTEFYRDKLVALDRDKCDFAYLQCRSLQARRVVEVGTSFGVSTIYLAAAVRDNARGDDTEGVVVTAESEPSKAAAARANFAEAGLAEVIDLREGDALETLREVGGPVDFVLMDTWIPIVMPALRLLIAHLRPGAMVVCDNVGLFAQEYTEYTDFVRNPANGFRSILIPYKGGFEVSVRVS